MNDGGRAQPPQMVGLDGQNVDSHHQLMMPQHQPQMQHQHHQQVQMQQQMQHQQLQQQQQQQMQQQQQQGKYNGNMFQMLQNEQNMGRDNANTPAAQRQHEQMMLQHQKIMQQRAQVMPQGGQPGTYGPYQTLQAMQQLQRNPGQLPIDASSFLTSQFQFSRNQEDQSNNNIGDFASTNTTSVGNSTSTSSNNNRDQFELDGESKSDDQNVTSKFWDEAENNVLRAAIGSYGNDWTKIAEHLPGRSSVQCMNHWKNISNVKALQGKGSWTPEEDDILRSVVEKYGARNWNSVVAPHLQNRLGKQCRERWVNHLDPKLKKASWTEEEENILKKAHKEVGNKWAQISKLLPGRSDNDVKNYWYANQRKRRTKLDVVESAYARKQNGDDEDDGNQDNNGRWSSNEGATLLTLVEKYGPKNWSFIAGHLPGRTEVQCLQHWRQVLNPNVVKGRGSWTPEEDAKLRSLVAKYGAKKWAVAIAPHLPGRIGKQCRERWFNTLNPHLKRSRWSAEEEAKMTELHQKFGNKWSQIARELPGRSDNDVKNHFYASKRRKKSRESKTDDANAENNKTETETQQTSSLAGQPPPAPGPDAEVSGTKAPPPSRPRQEDSTNKQDMEAAALLVEARNFA